MTGHNTSHKVVVIGGGYAGTLAANRLRVRDDVAVTLVNPRPEFVERIRLHQFVARTGQATIDYGTLLGEGVELVVDSATRIDTAARQVLLASGGALDYDYVIYAVGSTGAVPSVPGAAEHAWPLADLESARRLRARLDELPPGAPVTVVGGGLTGVETAAELAERGRAVALVCGRTLAPYLSSGGRRYVAKWLARHGVTVLEGVTVTEVRPEAIVLDDGGVRPSVLTIWTVGFGLPELAAASGLRTDALGRLLTDETLTSVDDERVVAAGDAAAPSGRPLRMSGYAAGPLGAQAADTVLSRIAGTEPAAIDLAFTGACVSLGRHAGIRQIAGKDDKAVNVYIPGRAGAIIKEMTCRFVVSKRIRGEARKPGSMSWPKGGPRPETPATAPVTPA
ncbi:NADH dehydrogenase [[Actinomadura] parvosata subsp. kistnae]|uniref:FAD-dependent oxidoreductase n=1 Tax=[Actinomadura] parvosata subsp. kistnae TaxID=1909395 RepID=A0A1V0A032_9ACTN|nr:FAD-dependent oxidoreductase [Nonomuraea sp. ATCC 55076]AQZ63558.1 FAD-dependent oxidoreductase [Nonomuraea sp. ATCC 55076]SPL99318.1 NADH dehydrogenase [Actinomadura parvosata subsp. kistnae]